MLDDLKEVRRLLETPGAENIRKANAELERLLPVFSALSGTESDPQFPAPLFLASLACLRTEIMAIQQLSKAASDYFVAIGQACASGFGAYERTGELRQLNATSRMLVQL